MTDAAAWYNDNDGYCCQVLRARIADGSLPPGDVDDRDITDIEAASVSGYGQWHLFAGIGGFPLGLTWAGLPPDTRILTGGFPCQDISTAGKGAGLSGKRSGLWSQMRRFVGVLRPDVVFVENVSALLVRGVGTVLGELAEIGYDCKWHCVPAAYVGAPHRRDRIWIVGVRDVAYAEGSASVRVADDGDYTEDRSEGRIQRPAGGGGRHEDVADAEGQGLERPIAARNPCAHGRAAEYGQRPRPANWWAVEPAVRRVANGVSHRVDRLKSLGNAVVPQVVEYLWRLHFKDPTP